MLNDLPDVLMGDVFADAVILDNLQEDEKMEDGFYPEVRIKLEEGESKPPSEPTTARRPAVSRTSADLISALPETCGKFFLIQCVDRATASSSSSSSTQGPAMSCDACNLVLKRSSVFIRCAECDDPLVDLCVYCFASGAELGTHKRTHAYSVVHAKNNTFTKNRAINKLNIFHVLSFMESAEKRGCFSYAELERSLGVSGGEVEKLYLEIIKLLSPDRLEEMDGQVGVVDPPAASSSAEAAEGGPANFNLLRDEFEHEYIPEAETLLAAVNPAGGVTPELISLFDGYNGILDERERRRKLLKSSNLINLREFFNIVKKRKSDEKDMFEKVRIFTRAVLVGMEPGGDVLGFLESLASTLTQRKRLMDRAKRLLLLRRHGIVNELAQSNQFDLDRKKRNDVTLRKAAVPPGTTVKVWTAMPNEKVRSAAPTAPMRGIRGVTALPPSSPGDPSVSSAKEALLQLPGAESLTDDALDLCVEFNMAPQHFVVVQSAVHSVLKHRGPRVSDDVLLGLVNEGIFGTVRRYVLGAQGLPVSATGQQPTQTSDEMKKRLIDHCRSSSSPF